MLDATQVFKDDVLAGKTAIVTGGGTGIGRSIASSFARCGAQVVIASRNPEHLEEGMKALAPHGDRCLAQQVNIRNPEQVEELLSTTLKRFGRVDVLVNNAGGQYPTHFEDITIKGWHAVIDNNLNGTFHCMNIIGKQMIKQRGGKIINIVLNMHGLGAPGVAHSAAARAGVVDLTKTVAVEWAKYNILVNAIGVGRVLTEGSRQEMVNDEEVMEQIRESVPLKRWGREDECAALALFLASDAGNYITGEDIIFDGGNRMTGGLMHMLKKIPQSRQKEIRG